MKGQKKGKLLPKPPKRGLHAANIGATRDSASNFYLDEIEHYVYAGDTLLHVAAAAYGTDLVPALVDAGADVRARNRRGAEPLHYAADGGPGLKTRTRSNRP